MHHTINEFVRTPPAVLFPPGDFVRHVAALPRGLPHPAQNLLPFPSSEDASWLTWRSRYMYWYPACPACRPRRAEQSAISPFLELALKTAVSGSPEALLHLISTFRSPCSPRGCPACAEGRRLRRRLCLRDRRSGPDAVGESAACMPKLEPRLAGRSEILRGPMLLCELQALRAAKRTFQLSKGTKTLACCGGPHQPLLRRAHSLSLGLRVCILEIIKGGKDRPPSLEQQPAAICARDPAVLLDRTAVMQTQWSAAACNKYLPRFQHARTVLQHIQMYTHLQLHVE